MAKMTEYVRHRIAECSGEWLKGCVDWLVKEQCGCCHIIVGTDAKCQDYCICVGWTRTDEPKPGDYRVAWEIGRQSHSNVMQTDLDLDFELPYDQETGMSEGTYILEPLPKTKRDWEREAALVRKNARRVWREWAEDCDE